MSLLCPRCGEETAVIDSRGNKSHFIIAGAYDVGFVRRRRQCPACLTRYTTYEVSETQIKQLLANTAALELLQRAMRGEIKTPQKANTPAQALKLLQKENPK